jgi:hypothetical protein
VRWRRAASALTVAWLVAGCGVAGLFGPSGGPYPDACDDLDFAARQCKSMVQRAESQAGVKAADAALIEILPPTHDGVVRLSAHMISRVRFHLAGGEERTEEIWCIGVGGGGDEACNHDPIIEIGAGRVSGDVPCSGGGDPPTGCATPPPTPRPEIQALARPLRVPVLDIPLDHVGPYTVEVGEAGLPDGAFSMSSASVVDERPTSFWIRQAQLEIEPVDPKRPPVGSVYREPFDGVETVRVTLMFDVTEFSPGAVLQVRDIVVR